MELDPDWLDREMREATSDLALAFSPGPTLGSCLAGTMVPPLDPGEARRLREKMAGRYREWTGRDLASDLGRPDPSPTDPSPSAGGDSAGTPSLREAERP